MRLPAVLQPTSGPICSYRIPKRLEAIINNKKYPVQFIFAGKAHPKDNEGKELIKQLFQFASKPEVRDKIVFLEDYDMHLARHLLQGADVWLNTPRRPLKPAEPPA